MELTIAKSQQQLFIQSSDFCLSKICPQSSQLNNGWVSFLWSVIEKFKHMRPFQETDYPWEQSGEQQLHSNHFQDKPWEIWTNKQVTIEFSLELNLEFTRLTHGVIPSPSCYMWMGCQWKKAFQSIFECQRLALSVSLEAWNSFQGRRSNKSQYLSLRELKVKNKHMFRRKLNYALERSDFLIFNSVQENKRTELSHAWPQIMTGNSTGNPSKFCFDKTRGKAEARITAKLLTHPDRQDKG